MIENHHNLEISLLTEETPVIQKLLKEFKSILPSWFSKLYFVPSGHPNFKSVLRANCGNKGCSVRAVVHLVRGDDHILRIEEETPNFDRLSNPCNDCREFFKN